MDRCTCLVTCRVRACMELDGKSVGVRMRSCMSGGRSACECV